MPFIIDQHKDLAGFPLVLRELLTAELDAGNEVVRVDYGFPAPPIGANVRLARAISSRRRTSGQGLIFGASQGSLHGGYFTDDAGRFFVLEPALPPPPEPDMDAIRAAHAPSTPRAAQIRAAVDAAEIYPLTPLRQFERSMILDYDKWHDGVGYDLVALRALSAEEQTIVERRIIGKGVSDWRDVEALAAIDSPNARVALRNTLDHANAELRGAVMRHAPSLVSDEERTEVLIKGLRSATLFGGLSETLDQVASFHPPAIVAQLFRGTLQREGDVAVHFAAMLCFIHQQAEEPFDWAQRPLFLRFDTRVRALREIAFRELCEKIRVDAALYLNDPSR